MPKVRIGFSSDFVLENSEVGIGTTNPTVTLDVYGVAKADFHITGVATLTSYSGFVSQKQNISTASTIGFNTTGIGTVGITSFISVNEKETGFISLVGEFNTLSEDLIVDDGKILDVSTIRNIGVTTIGTQNVYVPTNTAVSLGTLESVNVTSHFSVPNGGISSRFPHAMEGMVRFNDDLNTLEFYNGVEWRQFTVDGSSGRGVFGGGITPTVTSVIQYINISSLGNSLNFGSLTASRGFTSVGNCSSSTRGLYGGGLNPALVNIIEYITIASEGNSIDFGDLSSPATGRYLGASCSSSIRGLFAGGYVPTAPASYSNVIDYVQISTIGNALDFGDLTTPKMCSGLSSPTRGIFSGGYVPGSTITQTMDVITMSSVGNAVSFGDMTVRRSYSASLSSATRGIFGGGIGPNSNLLNTIDFMTIATNGNAISFGDLSVGRRLVAGTSSQIRGVFAGGGTSVPAGMINTIDYVTIASTGNAQDFGDMSGGNIQGTSAFSDSHGGLGGF